MAPSRGRRPLLALTLAALLASCTETNTPPPNTAAKPPAVAPPPRPATGARWSFDDDDDTWIVSARSFEDGVTVWVGRDGRRAVRKGLGLVHAPTLGARALVSALRDESAASGTQPAPFAFVDSVGDVHLAADALGPYNETRKGPPLAADLEDEDHVVAVGKRAILVLERYGRLFRSTDLGRTWSVVAVPSAPKPVGGLLDVALTDTGEGLLVLDPQRVLVTSDDGGTWTKINSKEGGARKLVRDGEGRIFVETVSDRRMLFHGDVLTKTNETPKPFGLAQTPPKGRTRRALVDDRVLSVRALETALYVTVASLDGKVLHEHSLPAGLKPDVSGVSGSGPHLSVVFSHGADHESVLLQSHDGGATFTRKALGKGAMYGGQLWAGPRGFALFGPRGAQPPTVRAAGSDELVTLIDDKSFLFRQVAFDETRAYVLAALGERVFLHVLDLSKPVWGKTFVELERKNMGSDLAADADHVSVLTHVESGSGLVVRRFQHDGSEVSPSTVPIGGHHAVFAGKRGIVTHHGRTWETIDGLRTWAEIPWPHREDVVQCSPFGCITEHAARAGWDLDVGLPPAKTDAPPASEPGKPKPAELRCKLEGAWSKDNLWDAPSEIELGNGVSWIALTIGADESVRAVVGAADKTSIEPLLGPEKQGPKHRELRTTFATTRQGAVAIRYSFEQKSKSAPYKPVDVELAWYSVQTKKVARATLTQLPPFRVSRAPNLDAFVAIAGDALVFRAGGDDQDLYVLRPGGKVEKRPGPQHLEEGAGEAIVEPKRMLLLRRGDDFVQLAGRTDEDRWWETTWQLGLAHSAGLNGWTLEAVSADTTTVGGLTLQVSERYDPDVSKTWWKQLPSVPACATNEKLPASMAFLGWDGPLVAFDGDGPETGKGPRPISEMQLDAVAVRNSGPCIAGQRLTTTIHHGSSGHLSHEGGVVSGTRGTLFHKPDETTLLFRPMVCGPVK